MAVFKLIRWSNLLIIAGCQLLIKWGILDSFGVTQNLNQAQFFLLVLATVCIAAGGNIINDIQDVAIDAVNKPKRLIVGRAVSEKTANFLYIIFTVIGVVAGFVLSNWIGKPNFAVLFVGIAALLYFYAISLKQMFIISNLVIAVIVAFSLLIVPFFEFLPPVAEELTNLQKSMFLLVFYYALFAFMLTFLRELLKDIIDIDGDHNQGIRSIPIVVGRERASNIALALGILTLGCILYYTYIYSLREPLFMAYFFVGLAAPLLLFCIRVFNASSKEEFRFLSLLLKIIMCLGIGSMALYKFI